MGEFHLKNKNKAAAIEAYKRCVDSGKNNSELDDWFINRAKRKLSELLNQTVPLICDPNIKRSG